MVPLTHRRNGYALLSGNGLEIGALNEPAEIPEGAAVQYLDAIDETQAAALYREIPGGKFAKVSFIGDLDHDGLVQFRDGAFDFVVMNHVLEHVANPVKAVREVFRICREGGIVAMAVPDKDYTFDRRRELTPWGHLWSDYMDEVKASGDDHYESFLRSAAPHVFDEPPENLKIHIQLSRTRREHAHVWNSESFEGFLRDCFLNLGIDAALRYRSVASENGIEHFSVWQKRPAPGRR
jgi:SAM-dependent methyltransferase